MIVENIDDGSKIPSTMNISRDVIIRSVDELTGEIHAWIGNAEKIRVGLLKVGVSKDDRNSILADEQYINHELVKRLKRGGDIKPYMDPTLTVASPVAEPRTSGTPRASSRSKETYKIYPGGARYGGAPAVTRVKSKVYKSAMATEFKPGEQAVVEPKDGRLRVRKTDSDHEQTWEPD